MRNTFTLLRLGCGSQCYLWWHWELLQNWNSEQMVGCLIEKWVQQLTKPSQLMQLMCLSMKTFWMKQAPCWILRQVQAATQMMTMMEQEYQLRNPQDRVQPAYQPAKKQMDYNSGIQWDDQICMQNQTYKIHAVYNECKVVRPDYQTQILDACKLQNW